MLKNICLLSELLFPEWLQNLFFAGLILVDFACHFLKRKNFFHQFFFFSFLHKCSTSTLHRMCKNIDFSLTRILSYKDRICPYTGIYRSENISILEHFSQCYNTIIFTYFICTLHKSWCFPLRISLINVNKSSDTRGFVHIYYSNF